MTNTGIEKLQNLQQRIINLGEYPWRIDDPDKILFTQNEGLFIIECYVCPMADYFSDILTVLCDPDVAYNLSKLVFRCPDEGANGTTNYDFTELINRDVIFANLTEFFVEPYLPDYGNHPIIAYSLEEEGMISKLFNKMPNLLFLTLSNAPNALFFEGQSHPLKYLRLDAGYFHENFILNLGQSNRFLNLRHLDFGEFNEQYLDKYPDECTPFDHYIALFQSKVFEKLNVFTLRNSVMTQEQIQELRLLNKNVDFNLVYSDKD